MSEIIVTPIILDKKKCPNSECFYIIDEDLIHGQYLDDAVIDNKTGAITFEVKAECPVCGTPIYGILWLVEINDESKFEKMAKGL